LYTNGLLRHFIAGNRRKERRDGKAWKKREQLLDDCKETRSWKLKEEALDRAAWKTLHERC